MHGDGSALGDVAVLSSTLRSVAELRAALEAVGIATIDLEKYDDRVVDAVKVGTIKRAKGLEFKSVVVARVSKALLGPVSGELSDVDRELEL